MWHNLSYNTRRDARNFKNKKQHGIVDKSTLKQVFVLDSHHFYCAKNAPVHLVLVGLTAGWQADEV